MKNILWNLTTIHRIIHNYVVVNQGEEKKTITPHMTKTGNQWSDSEPWLRCFCLKNTFDLTIIRSYNSIELPRVVHMCAICLAWCVCLTHFNIVVSNDSQKSSIFRFHPNFQKAHCLLFFNLLGVRHFWMACNGRCLKSSENWITAANWNTKALVGKKSFDKHDYKLKCHARSSRKCYERFEKANYEAWSGNKYWKAVIYKPLMIIIDRNILCYQWKKI